MQWHSMQNVTTLSVLGMLDDTFLLPAQGAQQMNVNPPAAKKPRSEASGAFNNFSYQGYEQAR